MPYLVPVDKKIHEAKFELKEENQKIANSKGTALETPTFLSGFEMNGKKIFINYEDFERFYRSKLKKIKGKAK